MQCGCPECGRLMVQAQRGLRSCCVCPDCGNTCGVCMGGLTPMPKPSKATQTQKEFDEARDALDQE